MTPEETQKLNLWIDVNLFDGGKFVGVMKRGLWYRPDARGYTDNVDEAGRWTRGEANMLKSPKTDRALFPNEEPVTIHEFPVRDYTEPRLAMEVLRQCIQKQHHPNSRTKTVCFCTDTSGVQTYNAASDYASTVVNGETLEISILKFAQKIFSK